MNFYFLPYITVSIVVYACMTGLVAVVAENIVYKEISTIADLASTLVPDTSLCPGKQNMFQNATKA